MAGTKNGTLVGKNADFTQVDAPNAQSSESNGLFTNGQLWIGRTAVNAGGTHIDVNTLTGGTGISVTNGAGTITIANTGSLVDLHTARFIVGDTSNGANYSTIATAIAAASSGDTIFIQTGTYTEDLTLKAGVNLTAFTCDAFTPNVIILGKCTYTSAGTVSISGIQLKTNGDNFLAITGASVSIVYLTNCFLNCNDATGITFSAASSSAHLVIQYCESKITGANTLYTSSSTGNLSINFLAGANAGNSSTAIASNASAGAIRIKYSFLGFPLSTSSTGSITLISTSIETSVGNNTSLTTAGTATSTCTNCFFTSGSAGAVSIGAGTTLNLQDVVVSSSNTNAITGAGALNYGGLTFISSSTINVTTQTLINEGPSRTIGSANSGGTNTLTVTNTSNTASSQALINSQVAGATAADAYYKAEVSGGQAWTWGLDNSVSDGFSISASATLGTTEVFNSTVAGIIALPSAGFTTDGVLYSLASGVLASTSAGTSGQVLTSNGPGVAPTYQANANGDVVGPASSTDNALVRFDGTTGKLIQNGVTTEDDTGNISQAAAVSGANLSYTLSNTSNTASSNALQQLTVAGTSAGDAFTTYTVSGTTNWSQGVDNSDSDAYVLAASTALGTTNVIKATTAGEVTMPLQPSFSAYLAAGVSNATGDGTNYVLGTDALTELYDVNGDFNTNGTFTAPVTGKYLFTYGVLAQDVVATMTAQLTLTASGTPYTFGNYGTTVTGNMPLSDTRIVAMTAGDTATVTVNFGSGTKTVDIYGSGGDPRTFFSGNLIS